MRVLILGGTGLISTAIVEWLIAKKHTPVLFNRGISPHRFEYDLEQIQGDRADFRGFASAMKHQRFDAVIDMITFDAKTAAHNARVFRDKIDHFIFCSTVCVYGGPLAKVPAGEFEPHRPVSDYGRNKSKAEAVYTKAFRDQNFPITIMRPSHCYGPGAPLLDIWGYNASLVARIRKRQPILVPGDGNGLWQPGYIGDMAKGFVGALGRGVTIGKTYNITGDEVMTWRAFIERMARAIGHEAQVVPMTTDQIVAGAPKTSTGMLTEIFQHHAAYTNDALKADVPDFADLLAWEDGVRRTVAWMDAERIHGPIDLYPWVDSLAAAATGFSRQLAGIPKEVSRRKRPVARKKR
ncbi:MAG: NAD-dependent epimerase/dehydratase family protein [Candidatus Hydrogenedentes bacterium]|nr:NAD-dependent epimerase/dehydratase family protein [Candidatus Hydrogenedentota bacterium]